MEAKFNKVDRKHYNKETVFRSLPPLIKAYIRAGAWISDGAVCDFKFNTTDVLVILKSTNIIKKYSNLSFKNLMLYSPVLSILRIFPLLFWVLIALSIHFINYFILKRDFFTFLIFFLKV